MSKPNFTGYYDIHEEPINEGDFVRNKDDGAVRIVSWNDSVGGQWICKMVDLYDGSDNLLTQREYEKVKKEIIWTPTKP